MNILSIYSFFSILFLPGDYGEFDFIIPLWAFWAFPPCWIAIIPITAVLCSIVMYISMLRLKINNRLKILGKTIIKVIFFRVLCDLIVVGFLLLLETRQDFINPKSDFYHWYKNIFLRALERNPFSNVFALLLLCSIILLLMILNYQLNKRFTFSKLDIEEENKKKLALAIATFTAPYIFLFPIELFIYD